MIYYAKRAIDVLDVDKSLRELRRKEASQKYWDNVTNKKVEKRIEERLSAMRYRKQLRNVFNMLSDKEIMRLIE